jgi:predicted nucleotidyltransferase
VIIEDLLMESSVKTNKTFEHYIEEVRQILQADLAEVPCRVYLFGSRAIGTAHPGSDADIAVAAEKDVTFSLSQIRFALEESTIPYKVDLVDLSQTSPDFRQQVLTEGKLIWKN